MHLPWWQQMMGNCFIFILQVNLGLPLPVSAPKWISDNPIRKYQLFHFENSEVPQNEFLMENSIVSKMNLFSLNASESEVGVTSASQYWLSGHREVTLNFWNRAPKWNKFSQNESNLSWIEAEHHQHTYCQNMFIILKYVGQQKVFYVPVLVLSPYNCFKAY